jgi:hypothetical protein
MSKAKSSPATASARAAADERPETKPSDIVRANVSREETTSPSFVSLYANDTQIQVSPWDVRLIFGEISQPATPERPTNVIKQTGEVRMSVQHAKVVVTLLFRALKNYEETIGPIPIPK